MIPLKHLIDTSVVSQTSKRRPDPVVQQWWMQQPTETLAISSVVLQELRFGIELQPAGQRRRELEQWLEVAVARIFNGRVLPVDERVADISGRLLAAAKKVGHHAEMADTLIAATGIVHGLKVATLNRKHFERLGVELVTF